MEKKTKKGPVKVTTPAAAPSKAKKKRYYPSKPKAKIATNKTKVDGNLAAAKAAEKVKFEEPLDPTVTATQPEPATFVWDDESQAVVPQKKTWIQRVLEWLPRIERK